MINKLKFGISTFLLGKKDFDSFFEKVKDFPIEYMEFKTDPPNFFPPELKDKDIQEIKEKLKSRKLKSSVHSPIYDINIGSLNQKMRQASVESILESLEFAKKIDAEVLVIHGGNLPGDFPTSFLPGAREMLISSLKKLVEKAKEKRIVIGLENTPKGRNHQLVKRKEEHLSIIEKVNSSDLKVVLDTGHANVYGLPLEDYLKSVSKYLCEIHLHNNDGKKDFHQPLTRGEIDISNLLDLAKELELSVPIILEMDSVEDFKESFDFLLREKILLRN